MGHIFFLKARGWSLATLIGVVSIIPSCAMGQSLASLPEETSALQSSVSFSENKGQILDQHSKARKDILFYGENEGMTFYLSENGISYQQYQVATWKNQDPNLKLLGTEDKKVPDKMKVYRTDFRWVKPNRQITIKNEAQLPGISRFRLPNGSIDHKEVRSYGSVVYQDVFEGVDVKWYGTEEGLKYDYYVAPYADYSTIQWRIQGAKSISVDESGDLIVQTPVGYIREAAPIAFQSGRPIPAAWVVQNEIVSFQLGEYDLSKPLIIDPSVRQWGTYCGGGKDDFGRSTATDPQGNVYLTGYTSSTKLIATTGAHQSKLKALFDAFLVKYNRFGKRIWGTYFGGASDDYGWYCAVDSSSNVYVSGYTYSSTSIATTSAHQATYGQGGDAFLLKFGSTGKILWGTYYGGDKQDFGWSCAVDESLAVYLTGSTKSKTGISTNSSHQSKVGGNVDGYLVKFDKNGVRQWGTYYGGASIDIIHCCATNKKNEVAIAGASHSSSQISTKGSHQESKGELDDGFLAKFDAKGIRQWGTYYGGDATDGFYGCAFGASTELVVAGFTGSDTLMTTSGSHDSTYSSHFDALLIKFDNDGKRQWATYYGDSSFDVGTHCAVGPYGSIFLTGYTKSAMSMATIDGFRSYKYELFDAYLARFDKYGKRFTGTYYGYRGDDFAHSLAVDNDLNIYIAGSSDSHALIGTNDGQQRNHGGEFDAYVVHFKDSSTITTVLKVKVCKSYTSQSGRHTWKKSGVYRDTLPSGVYGKDSVFVVKLKIGEGDSSTITQFSCDSLRSPSGKYLMDTSGIYFDTIPTTLGCDSFLTINFERGSYSSRRLKVKRCDFYNSPSGNHRWDSSGSYRDTVIVPDGCDSILFIDLVVGETRKAHLFPSVCERYSSPSGKHIWTQSGFYQDTVKFGLNCDSVFTIALEIRKNTSANLSKYVCGPTWSPSGRYLWTVSGTYYDTIANGTGCDSLIRMDLTFVKPDASVKQHGNALLAQTNSGSLRWLDCDNDYEFINETGKVYIPKWNGQYALEVNLNGCRDTSACFAMVVENVAELSIGQMLNVFPNPTSGAVLVEWSGPGPLPQVEVTNGIGQLISTYKLSKNGKSQFTLGDVPGIYFVRLISETHYLASRKIILE